MMKKIILTLTVMLCVLLTMIACTSADETTKGTTTESGTQTTTVDDKLPEDHGDPVAYCFYTMHDMQTYFSTGSTDVKDYLVAPSPTFDNFQPFDYMKNVYVDFESMFGWSEKLDERLEAARFGRDFDVGINLWFVFQEPVVYVCLKYSPGEYKDKTAEDIRREYYENIKQEFLVYDSMEAMGDKTEGFVKQTVNGVEVLYYVKERVPVNLFCLIDKFSVYISNMTVNNSETVAAHEAFMKDEAYAPLSVFFEEGEAREEAMAKLQEAIANRPYQE